MSTKKETKKKTSLPVKILKLLWKIVSKIGKLFLLVLKILPFASMCADRFGKKESTS
ncbi:MAG: hypothetical protein J6Y67_08215 [Lachnospiraceae bacterium]|nr:hypothetical protein [Lachnospiraceae bacterium]